MSDITTDYAAWSYGSTPETHRYVRRSGSIIGLVIRAADGWIACDFGPERERVIARHLPTMDVAVQRVVAAVS